MLGQVVGNVPAGRHHSEDSRVLMIKVRKTNFFVGFVRDEQVSDTPRRTKV